MKPGSLRGKETILLVEDDEMARNLICKTLTARGYMLDYPDDVIVYHGMLDEGTIFL